LLGKSGFLINSHDPLRVHVLKHIRQNSLTRLRYSVADMGTHSQNRCCVRARCALTVVFGLVCAKRTPGLVLRFWLWQLIPFLYR
jgi:hypothetical protein